MAALIFTPVDGLLIGVVAVLVVAMILLALSETSLVRVNRVKAMALEDEGRRGARHLRRVVEHLDELLNVILLLVLVSQLTAATIIGILADRWFGSWGVVAATAAEVIVLFVVAEALPKTLALRDPEKVGLRVAPLIGALGGFAPLRLASRGLAGIAAALSRGVKGRRKEVSEFELLTIADVAAEEEVIEREESALIRSVIELGDTVVREVMIPRPDMLAVDGRATVSGVLDVALQAGYSRVPVYTGNLDGIAGTAYVKDLIRLERAGQGHDTVEGHVRSARFVPETKRAAILMREMQRDTFHQAVVVDEYGSTAGLVSLEDLLEELVGEIADEYDAEEPHIVDLTGGTLLVPARTPVDELSEVLGVELPTGTWDSVGGLVFNLIGHVPKPGEQAESGGCRFVVERVRGRRIDRLLVVHGEASPGAGSE